MKNAVFKIIYIITAVVVVINLVFVIKGGIFTDISKLPEGTLSYSDASPSGDRILNVYVVKNNLGVAVRGEIKTATQKYNIFWQVGSDLENAGWVDEHNIVINDITLDSGDKFGYDCRRGYSLFDEGSLAENSLRFES